MVVLVARHVVHVCKVAVTSAGQEQREWEAREGRRVDGLYSGGRERRRLHTQRIRGEFR